MQLIDLHDVVVAVADVPGQAKVRDLDRLVVRHQDIPGRQVSAGKDYYNSFSNKVQGFLKTDARFSKIKNIPYLLSHEKENKIMWNIDF